MPSQKTQAMANKGKRNQTKASVKEYIGILEKAADRRQTAQKTNAAFTQNIFRNAVCFNFIARITNPMQITDIHASAGLLSMSKMKGPNIQKIRHIFSALDNSDNASRLSRQNICMIFQTE